MCTGVKRVALMYTFWLLYRIVEGDNAAYQTRLFGYLHSKGKMIEDLFERIDPGRLLTEGMENLLARAKGELGFRY